MSNLRADQDTAQLSRPGTAAIGPEDVPAITAVDPPQAAVLTNVTISGVRFTPQPSMVTDLPTPIVTFFDGSRPLPAAVRGFTNTTITTRVPNGAKTGFVEIVNTRNVAAAVPGRITVLPTIASFSPTRGGVTSPVTIRGTGLYNTPRFFFTGRDGAQVEAAFSNPTLESIVVAVPTGAETGPITVITDGGGTARTATSFVVAAAVPQIGDLQPRSGPVGTTATITAKPGTRFESVQSVSFLTNPDGVGQERRIRLGRDQFADSGDLQRITCRVPQGAVTGRIRVVNESGADSTPVFTVTTVSA